MNPYQPPTRTETSIDDGQRPDRILIHGDVQTADLIRLLGTPWLLRVLQVVCVVAVAFFSLMPLVAIVMRNNDAALIASLIGMVVFMALILYTVVWFLGPRGRAKRMLKRHPGIVGPIDGWIDKYGLTYHSEAYHEHHQISWDTFTDVAVTNDGLRLAWSGADPFTAAIPASAIDGFSARTIKPWVNAYRNQATEPAIARVLVQRDSMPSDGIWFQCLIPSKLPLTAAESRRIKIYGAVQTVMYLSCFVWYLLGNLPSFGFWFLVITPTFVAIAARRDYARAATSAYQTEMWGWITGSGVVGHVPGQVWEQRWENASVLQVDAHLLRAEFPEGSGVHLTPNDVDGDWTKVTELVRDLKTSNDPSEPSSLPTKR
ncbi:hypothetical protein [Rubripirellula reticaptiva]|uniref:Uncharacterized protein n=1 Tax=Rubripirellula reticaptiva TaxID=2528013 RepID=A0A5C6EUC2_9BACT|nr:hypothetical protein [Rubripirellula reticaptiva]TWU51890.1 hypothetical protein Poly59_34860 [Rubripirellula reticaptiva]